MKPNLYKLYNIFNKTWKWPRLVGHRNSTIKQKKKIHTQRDF